MFNALYFQHFLTGASVSITKSHAAKRSSSVDQPRAYSYLRFSTPEQMQGDSMRRQTALAAEWAARHKIELDDSLTFQDLGVSAYRGRNAETGKLADFREAVECGLVPRGSYLLVESLDRISRQAARKALRVLEDIVDRGVTLVTLNDGRSYDTDTLDSDPTALIMALLTFIRANEESVMKGRRLKAAWTGKRQKARDAGKPLTAWCPSWLRLDRATNQFQVIEERAAVVRRIYGMLLDGCGINRISETLNKEGVPTFAGGKTWHRSYVKKIGETPAVIGQFTPHAIEYVDGKKTRKPLEAVLDYYPAIIDEATFNEAQALRPATGARAKHRRGQLANVLAGLARCPLCKSAMTRVMKGPKGGKPYLVCTKAKAGAGCQYRGVPVALVEEAIIRDGSVIAATAPAGDPELERRSDRLDAALGVLREQISHVVNAIAEGGGSVALSERLGDMEAELERMHEERRELDQQLVSVAGPVLAKRLIDLYEALTATPLDRERANALLRQLLNSVTVDYRTGRLMLAWKNGGASEVLFGWPES